MKLGVVIVTYNRIEHLKRSIKKYINQTYKPKLIVIVDNHSNDGTIEFLKLWEQNEEGIQKKVLYLENNIGGSGGFYEGLKYIQSKEYIDWIWVADDDAYPALDAFANIKKVIENHNDDINTISTICGVCGSDGHFSRVQRQYLKKTIFGTQEFPIPVEMYHNNEEFEIDLYSFVGTVLKRKNLLIAGLPRKDFFIYQDDLEHAVRMKKTGRILCNKNIKIWHRDNFAPPNEISWRDYYANRNIVIMYKEHFNSWSLIWRIFRRLLMTLFLGRKILKIKVSVIGIIDGLNGKMGIHPVYKPGWNVK